MRFVLIVVLFSYTANLESKSFSLEDYTVKDKKLKHLVISEAAVFSLALVGFNELWYKNYPKSNFQLIALKANDKFLKVFSSAFSKVKLG